MAKQTFTTGQVLTAAQMTSLQQTAMGGGEATAKTASYVLTAADAGTTVIMNAAGATTITVNTALFAAGDTVNIQNIGAGICTVTAGTATVNTAGSLALSQYEGGVLYFRSTSTATFFDYVQTGTVSPLTTKGDLWTYSTVDARLGVGTNGQVLTAASGQATGLSWATPTAPAASYSLLGSATLSSGTTVTISGISGMNKLYVFISNGTTNTAGDNIGIRFNTDTGSNYVTNTIEVQPGASYAANMVNTLYGIGSSQTYIRLGKMSGAQQSVIYGSAFVDGCNSSGLKMVVFNGSGDQAGSSGQSFQVGQGWYTGTSTISSVSAVTSGGNFDQFGDFRVYGSA
jgi:hypothetical protein